MKLVKVCSPENYIQLETYNENLMQHFSRNVN